MEIASELKQTLAQFLELCREFGIHPRLIGGLAVRGLARRKRFTHDIDLAISRHDKPNLIALLKQMGFEYQDQTQFEGIKASKRIGEMAVEIHVSVERLWDMTSNQTYTLSPESVEVPIDEAGNLLAPTASAEDLLILKLMPLRDRDMSDVIALLLDVPDIDARVFWTNCERTGNTRHIAAQLAKLKNALKSGEFRHAWADYYGDPLPMRDILTVVERVRSLQKTKR
ncbi:MAG: nucleotidyltransferase [Chloroflexi bacterium]|nr:nucleotidyltransferase [Chloroflexota bacterium]